jgi:hypothetical protein
MRALLAALVLAASVPALADDEPQLPDAESRQELRRAEVQGQLTRQHDQRAKLVAERDAAQVKANTYALPQYRLEAQKKQEQIDALDAQIAKTEKELRELQE